MKQILLIVLVLVLASTCVSALNINYNNQSSGGVVQVINVSSVTAGNAWIEVAGGTVISLNTTGECGAGDYLYGFNTDGTPKCREDAVGSGYWVNDSNGLHPVSGINDVNMTGSNVTANYYFGDGSQLSNLPAGGNASWNQSLADTLYYPLNSNPSSYTSNGTDASFLTVIANYFYGVYDWIIGADSQSYLSFNGTQLDFNETKLNETILTLAPVDTDWTANHTTHVVYPYDANDKVCVGSSTDCANPSSKFVVIGGSNITGMSYFDNVATFNSMTGNANFNNNITATDIIANNGGYLMGQPLTGMLGSGLIYSAESSGSTLTGINLTCVALTCSYNNFTVRIASATSNTTATYCNIPAGSLVVPDNTNAMYYVDNTCTIQQTTYDTWFTTLINQGSKWDFANILTHSGSAEVIDSISLEQRRLMKARILNYYEWQGKVLQGFNFQTATFPKFNITSGKYVYGMDVVPTIQHNISSNNLEVVYHTSSTTWGFSDQSGLNLTTCDTGTGITTCSGSNYRRHFIFSIGYDDTGSTSEIHQLLPYESITYSTLANCLDTNTNPLQYTLPTEYTGAAVMLYAYCAKRTDVAWTTSNLIDMRTIKTGAASGAVDTSQFVPYSGATANVALGSYNLSATDVKVSTINGDGTALTINGNVNMDAKNLTTTAYGWFGFLGDAVTRITSIFATTVNSTNVLATTTNTTNLNAGTTAITGTATLSGATTTISSTTTTLSGTTSISTLSGNITSTGQSCLIGSSGSMICVS